MHLLQHLKWNICNYLTHYSPTCCKLHKPEIKNPAFSDLHHLRICNVSSDLMDQSNPYNTPLAQCIERHCYDSQGNREAYIVRCILTKLSCQSLEVNMLPTWRDVLEYINSYLTLIPSIYTHYRPDSMEAPRK